MTEDYPRTLLELEQRFSDEADCRAYLFVCGGHRVLCVPPVAVQGRGDST